MNLTRIGRTPFSGTVEKGLRWLETDDNSVASASSVGPDYHGYVDYGLERVGLASGFKHFGAHDWYRETAQELVKTQAAEGHWSGDRSLFVTANTAYCLLFLARGRHPILMAKLRFDGVLPASALPGLDITNGREGRGQRQA